MLIAEQTRCKGSRISDQNTDDCWCVFLAFTPLSEADIALATQDMTYFHVLLENLGVRSFKA